MALLENKTFDEIELGDSASIKRTLTDEDIKLFAIVSGDVNPVHLDDEYAQSTMFGQRIAHGVWTVALVSAVGGTLLPGPGTIFLGQSVMFLKPVFIGDTIEAKIIISKKEPEKKIVTFVCVCTNQRGEAVIKGEGKVMAPVTKVSMEAPKLPEVEIK